MLSDVFIVYYPKNYIPSEQKAFEEAEHDFIPSDNHLSKDNRGEIQIYEGHSKTISYLSTYSNVGKFITHSMSTKYKGQILTITFDKCKGGLAFSTKA